MPILNVHPRVVISGTQQAANPALVLRRHGLLIGIEITLPDALSANLTSQGLPIPNSRTGQALIDTGASISGIHEPIAQALGLQPTGPATLGGIQGANQHNLYQIKASFPGSPLATQELSVVGVNMEGQGKIFLLGMDLLTDCVLVYNGPMGCFTLAR